jgi:N-acetylglucosaminyl-diphospho-decaprenol L-rhamnosyltransferase
VKVAAIFVNYRTSELTVRAVQALLAELEQESGTAGEASHVFVVDNDSQDASYQAIFAAVQTLGLDRRVTVLGAPRNGGYGYGINFAVRRALAAPDRPEYFYVINTDAFVDRGSLGKLIAFMDGHAGAGMTGSLVHDPDGVTQGAAFRFPSPLGELEQTARFGVVSRLLRRYMIPMPPPNEDREVDWLPGTSMLIRAAVFEGGTFFDEDFFLYFEEVDFARQLRQGGWRSYFVAGAPITHIGSVSTGLAEQGRRLPDYWFDSRHRYLRKHHSGAYTAAADLAWLAGHLVFLSKRAALGRSYALRRNLMRDFLRASARQLARGQVAVSRAPEPSADHRPAAALSFAALVAEDFATVEHDPLDPGFWAVLAHRLASKSRQARSLPARGVLSGVARALGVGVDWLWRISLPASVELGRRVRLHHGGGGMLLNARAIGNDVQIRHDTTFGPLHAGDAGRAALPVIEDGVDFGAGVSVLGGITVGRGAVVVANSLVLKDVTAGATVLGVPAKSAPANSADDGPILSPPSVAGSGLSTAGLVQRLIEDVRTYGSDFTEVGLWVTAVHRIRQWAERTLPGPLRSPVRAGAGAFMTSVDWLFGIRVPAEATLGRRVRIWHHGCIRLAATIGDDVHIRPNTTLGPASGPADDPARWPVIGDKVDIGAGASVLGPVRVGNEAFVGANSLVLADVPAKGATLGVPARLLPRGPLRKPADPVPTTATVAATAMKPTTDDARESAVSEKAMRSSP